jgi:hypothetical protein
MATPTAYVGLTQQPANAVPERRLRLAVHAYLHSDEASLLYFALSIFSLAMGYFYKINFIPANSL